MHQRWDSMSASGKRHSKRGRSHGKTKGETPARGEPSRHRGGADGQGSKPGGPVGRRRKSRRRKRPILKFVSLFTVFMGLFYLCEITPFFLERVLPPYTQANAQLSGMILGVFNEDVTVRGESISSPRYAISVRHGCDALLPAALFVSAALASPVLFWTKIPGIILGSLCILIMNLIRIVTLFYSGIYIPNYFERMHLEVWPAIFIVLSIFLWVVWALWAREKTRLLGHVAT